MYWQFGHMSNQTNTTYSQYLINLPSFSSPHPPSKRGASSQRSPANKTCPCSRLNPKEASPVLKTDKSTFAHAIIGDVSEDSGPVLLPVCGGAPAMPPPLPSGAACLLPSAGPTSFQLPFHFHFHLHFYSIYNNFN